MNGVDNETETNVSNSSQIESQTEPLVTNLSPASSQNGPEVILMNQPKAKRSRKLFDEGRKYKSEWDTKYFTFFSGSQIICLICLKPSNTVKEYNVARHAKEQHADFLSKLSSDESLRKDTYNQMKRKNIDKLRNSLILHMNTSQLATIASLKITELILKKQMPLSSGAIIKEAIIIAMECLLSNHPDKGKLLTTISTIQLSRPTVTRRAATIAEVIDSQLKKQLKNCLAISVCMDESTDINDVAQLLIFVRLVDSDLNFHDKLIAMKSLKSTTTGYDIFEALQEAFSQFNISVKDLVSATTDGASAMKGLKSGVIGRLLNINPNCLHFHCIIHQEALSAKYGIPNAKTYADLIMKLVNKCVAAGALRHRRFKKYLEDTDADFSDLTKMQQVRWLSCEKVFKQFFAMRTEIFEFLQQECPEFDCQQFLEPDWIEKLAFMTDITSHLAGLNRNLQGKQNLSWNSFESVIEFKMKLQQFIHEFQQSDFSNFQSLDSLKVKNAIINKDLFVTWLKSLFDDFEARFRDFENCKVLFEFPRKLHEISLDLVGKIAEIFKLTKTEVVSELIEYKSKMCLQSSTKSLELLKQYKLLTLIYAKITSIFPDSYLCESAFSALNFILNEYRTSLTLENTQNCLKIAINVDEIDFMELVGRMNCQVSH